MLWQNRANQLRALFDAQLSAVQRHIVRLNLPPFLAGVEAIIGASALILILQPLLRSLGPLAVLFHNALCSEGHICMNEDLQNIGTVLQDKVRTPADNDAGALLCQIRNDIALNLPEDVLIGGPLLRFVSSASKKPPGVYSPALATKNKMIFSQGHTVLT